MKFLLTLTLGLLFTVTLFGQEDRINELVKRGIELNDQGKYAEAVAKYNAALEIDINSEFATYELSYTYMTMGQYDNAVKYSKKVIKQNGSHLHEAYVVLGSSLDMLGKSKKAVDVFVEGLALFPNSNLLNYNLALTYYKLQNYEKAEVAAINAIIAKPKHPSSHLALSTIVQAKEEQIKSLLPLYYFLMLEPNSQRSKINYIKVREMLIQGVTQKDEKNVDVKTVSDTSSSNEFSGAEMMVSLRAAARYAAANRNKSDMQIFVESTRGIFSILGEMKKDKTGFWWDIYVARFNDLVATNNYEAFCYYISKSINADDVKKWIADNPSKMQALMDWMNK